MARLRLILPSIALAAFAQAAEILSWRAPQTALSHAPALALQPLETPAADISTVFINPADRLMKTRETPKGMDWIIWNASTERWVAKGSWTTLSTLHWMMQHEPMMPIADLTFRIHPVNNRDATPDFTAEPLATKTIRIPSGQRIDQDGPPADKSRPSIEASAAATIWRFENPVVELRCALTGRVPGNPDLEVITYFSCNVGKPTWIARDFDGRRGLDFSVEARTFWFDGSPLAERLLIEKDGKAIPLHQAHRKSPALGEVIELPNGQWLFRTEILAILESAGQLIPPDPNVPNPFDPPNLRPKSNFTLDSIARPAVLAPWVDHELLDLLPVMKKIAIAEGLPDNGNLLFAGGDPIGDWAFGIAADRETAENYAMALGGHPRSHGMQLSVNLQDEGERRLLMMLGYRGHLSRKSGGSIVHELTLEPSEPLSDVASTDLIISERFTANDEETETRTGKVTLTDDVVVPTRLTNTKGETFPIRAKVRREHPFRQP